MLKQTLKQYSIDNPPNFNLGRKPEVQKVYDEFRLKRENRDKFLELVKDKLSTERFYLHLNDYPYDVEEPIQHWLLWWNKPLDINALTNLFFGEKLVCFWVNLSENNSIPEINHAHVFAEK